MTGKRKHVAIGLATAITATLAMTDSVSADDVLHDTMWMIDEETYDHQVWSMIAPQTCGGSGTILDRNTADDFTLGAAYKITTITAAFSTCTTAADLPFTGEGMLVEIYADIGGEPSNTPTVQHFVTTDTGLSVSPFMNALSGATDGRLLTIDLSSLDVTLESGTWWLSIVVIDEGELRYRWSWLRDRDYQQGSIVHIRCGNEAHGTTQYGCSWAPDQIWSPVTILHSGSPNSPWVSGDVAMKIEGTPVGEPKCAFADLNCDSSVGVADLLTLLSQWGTCNDPSDCSADLDESGSVGVSDLLLLLGNWG